MATSPFSAIFIQKSQSPRIVHKLDKVYINEVMFASIVETGTVSIVGRINDNNHEVLC